MDNSKINFKAGKIYKTLRFDLYFKDMLDLNKYPNPEDYSIIFIVKLNKRGRYLEILENKGDITAPTLKELKDTWKWETEEMPASYVFKKSLDKEVEEWLK